MPAATTFDYRIAGLRVRSALPLPGAVLAVDGGPADLEVNDGAAERRPRPEGRLNARSADGQRARLVAPGIGVFEIESGRRVTAWREPPADAAGLAHWILGPVLAVVATQRGSLVLHGAVIQIADGAVIVMGDSGAGKSTLAAAGAARGHAVLADDIAIVSAADDGTPEVHAHAPLVRVDDPTLVPTAGRSWPSVDKQVCTLPPPMRTCVPVAAVVVLEDAPEVRITRLGRADAAFRLLTHSFCRPLFTTAQQGDNLHECAHVATRVSVHVVQRPRRLADLPAVVGAIEQLVTGSG